MLVLIFHQPPVAIENDFDLGQAGRDNAQQQEVTAL